MPGAFTTLDGGRLKVLRASVVDSSGVPGEILGDGLTVACGDGAVMLLEVQRAGRSAMTAEAFLRGSPVRPGARFV